MYRGDRYRGDRYRGNRYRGNMLRNRDLCKKLFRTIVLCVLPSVLLLGPNVQASQFKAILSPASNTSVQYLASSKPEDSLPRQVNSSLVAAAIIVDLDSAPSSSSPISGETLSGTNNTPQAKVFTLSESHFIFLWVAGVLTFCAITLYLNSLRRFR